MDPDLNGLGQAEHAGNPRDQEVRVVLRRAVDRHIKAPWSS
jgi:hypothetical protein